MCSYVPKKNKAVILLSTMHLDASVDDDAKRKPKIINFYIIDIKLALKQWTKWFGGTQVNDDLRDGQWHCSSTC